MKYLNIDEKELFKNNSYYTAKEIDTQTSVWRKTIKIFEENKEKIEKFLKSIGDDYITVFTGAGTSEYIGNILEPILNRMGANEFRSIATTDIVNNPNQYLRNRKTLLVSFARSGNSPESLATINIANKVIDNIYHLFITCNEEGKLALIEQNENICTILLPKESNDLGFAMTSSFSSMLMMALLIFHNDTTPESLNDMISLIDRGKDDKILLLKSLAFGSQDRIIFLGSGEFKGLAQELSLKVMELTAGKVVSKYDSTLGFRHGPKAILNDKTIVFTLLNPDLYARGYDLDLLNEMFEENVANNIVCFSLNNSEVVKNNCKTLVFSNMPDNNINALFNYLICGQIYAFFKSQSFGITTDNPFPMGDVNRVVKNFRIYEY